MGSGAEEPPGHGLARLQEEQTDDKDHSQDTAEYTEWEKQRNRQSLAATRVELPRAKASFDYNKENLNYAQLYETRRFWMDSQPKDRSEENQQHVENTNIKRLMLDSLYSNTTTRTTNHGNAHNFNDYDDVTTGLVAGFWAAGGRVRNSKIIEFLACGGFWAAGGAGPEVKNY